MTANRTGMDLADLELELLEASIGRAHAEGSSLTSSHRPSAALASRKRWDAFVSDDFFVVSISTEIGSAYTPTLAVAWIG